MQKVLIEPHRTGQLHLLAPGYSYLPDIGIDLAYEVSEGFGQEYERFLGEECNRYLGARVKVTGGRYGPPALQARRWVGMWRALQGEGANPRALVEALGNYGAAQDVIDRIRKECAF